MENTTEVSAHEIRDKYGGRCVLEWEPGGGWTRVGWEWGPWEPSGTGFFAYLRAVQKTFRIKWESF